MAICHYCEKAKAVIKRPKNNAFVCKECFFYHFEEEVHQTILTNKLFERGERIALGASGGKGMVSQSTPVYR